jgi:hypothetical protein
MDEIKYEMIKKLGVIKVVKNGWTRELNIVNWNDKGNKLDIRDWAPDHIKKSKGFTFDKDDIDTIKEIFKMSELWEEIIE